MPKSCLDCVDKYEKTKKRQRRLKQLKKQKEELSRPQPIVYNIPRGADRFIPPQTSIIQTNNLSDLLAILRLNEAMKEQKTTPTLDTLERTRKPPPPEPSLPFIVPSSVKTEPEFQFSGEPTPSFAPKHYERAFKPIPAGAPLVWEQKPYENPLVFPTDGKPKTEFQFSGQPQITPSPFKQTIQRLPEGAPLVWDQKPYENPLVFPEAPPNLAQRAFKFIGQKIEQFAEPDEVKTKIEITSPTQLLPNTIQLTPIPPNLISDIEERRQRIAFEAEQRKQPLIIESEYVQSVAPETTLLDLMLRPEQETPIVPIHSELIPETPSLLTPAEEEEELFYETEEPPAEELPAEELPAEDILPNAPLPLETSASLATGQPVSEPSPNDLEPEYEGIDEILAIEKQKFLDDEAKAQRKHEKELAEIAKIQNQQRREEVRQRKVEEFARKKVEREQKAEEVRQRKVEEFARKKVEREQKAEVRQRKEEEIAFQQAEREQKAEEKRLKKIADDEAKVKARRELKIEGGPDATNTLPLSHYFDKKYSEQQQYKQLVAQQASAEQLAQIEAEQLLNVEKMGKITIEEPQKITFTQPNSNPTFTLQGSANPDFSGGGF